MAPPNGSLPAGLFPPQGAAKSSTPRTTPVKNRGAARWAWAVALAVLVAGVGVAAYLLTRPSGEHPDVILHTVHRETLTVTVTEKGTFESEHNRDIVCRVKAGNKGYATTINDVIPDGTRVKPGDELMVLDDSALEDQELNQKITIKQAYATKVGKDIEYQIAVTKNETTLKLAEIELDKLTGYYIDPAQNPVAAVASFASLASRLTESGLYRQELEDLSGQISLAQSEASQNKERAAWADRMVILTYMSPAQALAEKSRYESSAEKLRSLQSKRDLMQKFDRTQRVTDLTSKRDIARLEFEALEIKFRTDKEAANDVYQQELDRLKEIQRQRAACKIVAPADIKPDSMIVYFKPEGGNRGGSSSQALIEIGAQVKEGQKMLRIPNLDKMQATIKVHEAMVSRVKIGQKAIVRVDALADRQFAASVKWVSAVANQTDSWTSDVKLYQTIVRIDGELLPDGKIVPLSGEVLKPDMTAEVSISVDASSGPVLTVPLQSIIGGAEMGGTRDVFVKSGSGYERKPVVLGLYNEKVVEIRSGLAEGDEIVVNPKVLLGDKDKTKTRDGSEGKPDAPPEKAEPKSPGGPGAGAPGGGYPGGGETKGAKGGFTPGAGGPGGPGGTVRPGGDFTGGEPKGTKGAKGVRPPGTKPPEGGGT